VQDSLVSQGASASLSYSAGASANVSLGLSTSASTATATRPGSRGSTLDISGTWNPTPGLGFVLTHNLSRSRGGYMSALGGLAGRQAPTAQTEEESVQQALYKNARTRLGVNYAERGGRYAVGLDLGQETYHGGATAYLADSKRHDVSLYLNARVSPALAANLNLQWQSLNFLSEVGSSMKMQSAGLSLNYRAREGEHYTLSCQLLQSDTSGAQESAGTRMAALEIGGQRRLAEKTSLSSSLQFNTVGGAFDDNQRLTWLSKYSYRLNEYLSADAQLRHVRYNSLRETGLGGGDYVANLFSLGLSAGF